MWKPKTIYKTLNTLINRYVWIHLGIGIIGNIIFLLGTIMFLFNTNYAGWFFLVGSTGMLLNAIGNLIYHTEWYGKTALTDMGWNQRYHQKNNTRENNG